MEVVEGGTRYVRRIVVLKKRTSVKGKLKKMKKDYFSLVTSWKLRQKKLRGVGRKLKEKNVLIKSEKKVNKTRKLGRERLRRGPRELSRRWRYKICGLECFYGFTRMASRGVPEYAKLGNI